MDYRKLFEPIVINNVEIKNRIVMAPMAMADTHPAGYVSEQTKAFFAARTKGGVGLITLGGTVSTTQAWEESPFAGCYRLDIDDTLGSLCGLVDVIHAFGAKVFCEILPSFGRMGHTSKGGKQPVSCTAEPLIIDEENLPDGLKMPGGKVGEIPREVSISELIALEDESADSALRILAAGFDGIEITCHMSYLTAALLSPRVNRRTDMYGGSLKNRMRFLVNLTQKVRDRVGPDYPVGVKLNCNEHVDGGLTTEDYVEIAKILEMEGIDYISLSDGCYESMKYSLTSEDGTLLEHGEPQAFKKALSIPIMTHNLHNPDLAERAVTDGATDMVTLGRPLITDPEWSNKLREGRAQEIVKCDRDNFCMLRLSLGVPVRCRLNPNLGRERYMPEYWQPPMFY